MVSMAMQSLTSLAEELFLLYLVLNMLYVLLIIAVNGKSCKANTKFN
jgi:hypothetical protein